MLEREPGLGIFDAAYFLGAAWEIANGPNAALQHARITVNLGFDPTAIAAGVYPKDWQVHDLSHNATNVWEAVLRGRRVRIQTKRPNPQNDWILFDGVVTKCEPGWSGANVNKSRHATVYAQSIFATAANEPGQTLTGQWRRARDADLAVRDTAGDPEQSEKNACVEVLALPPIFNPRGLPNCHPEPLKFTRDEDDDVADEHVYVFADAGSPEAIPWTVAKILRYIEWAVMQPPPPLAGELVDVNRRSDTERGPFRLQLDRRWSSYGLKHRNLDVLLDPAVDINPTAGEGFAERALLRLLADVAVDHFNAIEAFAMIADRAGLMFYAESLATGSGTTQPFLRWTILGNHAGARDIHVDDGVSSTSPSIDSQYGNNSATAGIPADGRGLFLYVPTDGTLVSSSIWSTVAKENATEGQVLMDESGVRRGIRVQGEADEYEGSWDLLPGWRPDAWLDVDGSSQVAVDEALARIGTTAFNERYNLDEQSGVNLEQYGDVLRRWVLNEHGLYDPGAYKRNAGPWSSETVWEPFKFHTSGFVTNLDNRGDNGWTLRRRTFRPTIASFFEANPVKLGMLVQLSFDSGVTWQFHRVAVFNNPNECGIYFEENDLTQIADPTNPSVNFVTAFIRNRLRVRVHANIEGDDTLVAVAGRAARSYVEIDSVEYINRRGQFARQLRQSANSQLTGFGVTTPDRDDSAEAADLARRLRAEFQARKIAGRVMIPYLLRDGEAIWPGYRLGDEIVGILTQNSRTYMPLTGVATSEQPSTRVAGIVYRYRHDPAERVTELILERYTEVGATEGMAMKVPGDQRSPTIPDTANAVAATFPAS